MKNLHYGHCIIGVAVAAVLLVALGVKASTLGILAVALACPLMMFVMMRTMMGDQSARHTTTITRSTTTRPGEPALLRWGARRREPSSGSTSPCSLASGGWEHLRDQARTDWWLLTPIIVRFGTQVALSVELRHRHHAQHLGATTGAGSGASAVGMVACCAHHLVDLVPLLGAAGVAGFLFDWRIPLMVGGLAINLVAVAIAGRRLAHLTHPRPERCRAPPDPCSSPVLAVARRMR